MGWDGMGGGGSYLFKELCMYVWMDGWVCLTWRLENRPVGATTTTANDGREGAAAAQARTCRNSQTDRSLGKSPRDAVRRTKYATARQRLGRAGALVAEAEGSTHTCDLEVTASRRWGDIRSQAPSSAQAWSYDECDAEPIPHPTALVGLLFVSLASPPPPAARYGFSFASRPPQG